MVNSLEDDEDFDDFEEDDDEDEDATQKKEASKKKQKGVRDDLINSNVQKFLCSAMFIGNNKL